MKHTSGILVFAAAPALVSYAKTPAPVITTAPSATTDAFATQSVLTSNQKNLHNFSFFLDNATA